MNQVFSKRVLVYGSRTHPLSYFLTKQLNIKYHASNVFAADLKQKYEADGNILRLRMTSQDSPSEVTCFDRSFGCAAEIQLKRPESILTQIEENEITDVIDLTSGSLNSIHEEIQNQAKLHQPIFKRRVKLFKDSDYTSSGTSESDQESAERMPIRCKGPFHLDSCLKLPHIVYPVELSQYNFPEDLATFIFMSAFNRSEIKLDCAGQSASQIYRGELATSLDQEETKHVEIGRNLGIQNQSQLLTLTSYLDACHYLIERGIENDEEYELPNVTLSIKQLCKMLKKIHFKFEYEFSNECDTTEDVMAQTEQMSSVKMQRNFCEEVMTDIFDYHS